MLAGFAAELGRSDGKIAVNGEYLGQERDIFSSGQH
jgi:hypothetical protein